MQDMKFKIQERLRIQFILVKGVEYPQRCCLRIYFRTRFKYEMVKNITTNRQLPL